MSKVILLRPQRDLAPSRVDVCVLGMGPAGLPLAAVLARAGLTVQGVDADPLLVAAVNGGRYHHFDPDLADWVEAAVREGRLRASAAAAPADVFVVTSPVGHDPGGLLSADLGALFADLRALAPLLTGNELVVLETSGPLGMTAAAAAFLAESRFDLSIGEPASSIDIAYVGERPRPGRSIAEVGGPRAIGGLTPRASRRAAEFYRKYVGVEVRETDHRTAELVKLTESAYRDLNIAFANELSMICGDIDIDVLDVIAIANHHPRVDILRPGPGVGGHSIAIDAKFLAAASPHRAKLIPASRAVNESKPGWSIEQVIATVRASGAGKIACLGLTSKPGTDQFDESPAIAVARALTNKFPDRVVCADPYLDLSRADDGLQLTDTSGAMAAADLVVFLVAHDQFRSFRPRGDQTRAGGNGRNQRRDGAGAGRHKRYGGSGRNTLVAGR